MNRRCLCLIAALLSGVHPLLAQTAAVAPRPRPPLRLGRLTITPSVALRGFGIDRNVFNTPDDRKSDVTVAVEPGAEAQLDLRRLQLSLAGGASYLYFRTYKTERALNPYATARAALAWGQRSSVSAGVSWADTKDRVNFEVDQRVRHIARSVGGGVSLGLSRRLGLDLSAAKTETEFSDDAVFRGVSLRQSLNRTTQTASVSANYAKSNLSMVGLTGTVGLDRFPFEPVRNTDSIDVKVEGRFQPRALVAGRVSVGYLWARPLAAALPEYSGPTAHAELFYTLLEATQFGAFVERTRAYSFDPSAPYYLLNRFGGSVRRHLFRRVDVSLGAERSTPTYKFLSASEDLFAASPDDAGPTRGTDRFTVSLGVQTARSTRVSLDADYTEAGDGQSPYGGYDGLRMGISMSYGLLTSTRSGAR